MQLQLLNWQVKQMLHHGKNSSTFPLDFSFCKNGKQIKTA